METRKLPEDNAQVSFTDLQGIRRKGIYNAKLHGFQEDIDQEIPKESQFAYPEGDIDTWEYLAIDP
ncbi:hypothetical protein MUK70_01030 [Dyadobacter chenwenxiniae]|uniref:Uncharacterized protein n=1 Tax=Dyadobacter chenwenxiniae TaxID=2906456 RepID=A0A9X1PMH4_9BACT|nr:hypothetical protein [Dyadobacter chenwenxiniae]MCF0048482.1 hypothetical protein [Dyadobacter chenwenxiniae]MCF0062669.1 hypothetical protein [Dyadobacter chenwenxiniae]UON83587.1 hypothetical protein MUK70_01030 [Dyadobacter chenwenxiniae]